MRQLSIFLIFFTTYSISAELLFSKIKPDSGPIKILYYLSGIIVAGILTFFPVGLSFIFISAIVSVVNGLLLFDGDFKESARFSAAISILMCLIVAILFFLKIYDI